MEWKMDELIRQSLQQAARDTAMDDGAKVKLLLHVLTEFLGSQINEGDTNEWT